MVTRAERQDLRAAPAPGIGADAELQALRPWPQRLRDRLRAASFTLSTFIVLLVVWEGGVWLLKPPPWLIPAPSQVVVALYNGLAVEPSSRGGYYVHLAATLQAALGGWVIGSMLGIALGVLLSQFSLLERIFLPYVNATQTIPKIAIAPIFLVWLGIGIESKIALVITSAFFPNFLNALVGFKSVERDLLDMMRSLGATKWRIARRILVPSALPVIFASLELALLHSFLAAVAGEFVGARSGIGVLLLERSHTLDMAGVFALLIILAFTGWVLDSILLFVRSRVLFWSPVVRGQSVT